MTSAEELDIIEKILSGETELFEKLVLENQNRVYGLALKTLRSEEDALDISQEAFLKAYTGLASFRGESRFSVWLYRLTYNLCLDLLRKRQREKITPLYTSDEDESEIELEDLRCLPEDELMRGETRRAIREGMEKLPERHRQILVLREISGMSYADISAALGVSEGTVKSRISRARQKLAAILIEDGTISGVIRHKDREEAKEHD